MIKEDEKKMKEGELDVKKISDQQTQTDHKIEEILPPECVCPRCGAGAKRVMTKRGVHIKCLSCKYDSNQIFDFNKGRRQGFIHDCMSILKDTFPQFNFVENIPYNPDMHLTGRMNGTKKKPMTKYDIKILWMGEPLSRVRLELNQHITRDGFYEADECYVIGKKSTLEYLDKRDAVIIHFLVDNEEGIDKILMSRAKDVIKYGPIREDRFKNLQYSIPKDIRRMVVKSTQKDMFRIITADFFNMIYRNVKIL